MEKSKVSIVVENTVIGLEVKVSGVCDGKVRTIEPILLRGRPWSKVNAATLTDITKLIKKTFGGELTKLTNLVDKMVEQIKTYDLNHRFCLELTVNDN